MGLEIFPGATYSPALHIPRRFIFPGATYSLALHIPWCFIFPGATYHPALYISWRFIFPGAVYSPLLHIPWCYKSPGATYFPRRYIFPSAFTYPSVLHIQNDKKINTALGLIFFLETHIFGIFQKIVILHPSTPG